MPGPGHDQDVTVEEVRIGFDGSGLMSPGPRSVSPAAGLACDHPDERTDGARLREFTLLIRTKHDRQTLSSANVSI